MTMHAILLVGGRGTRLQPLTDTRPKPMLPIVDQPFLAHQIAWLREHGVTDITFACGFLPQSIVGYFGEGDDLGVRLHYVIEPEPLGTGGAIGFAARTAHRGRVIVCNGDVLTGLDLTRVIALHEERGAVGTIALTPVEDPSRYGLVRTDETGAVQAFLEKPTADQIDTNLINAGTYVLEPELIDRIPAVGQCNVEREIFPQFAGGNGLYAFADDAYWNDIGTIPSYIQANIDVLAGRVKGTGVASEDRSSSRREYVHPEARISADAVIIPPVWIGAGAHIREGATVGPLAAIGAGVEIAPGARVARSVVLEDVHLGDGAQCVDSVVGERAEIAARCSLSDGAVVAPDGRVERTIVRGNP